MGESFSNRELAERGYERFNRGDLDFVLDSCSEDISWEDAAEMPDARIYSGPDEVRSFLASFDRHWEELRFEPEEIVESGDSLLILCRVVGKGKASGATVEQRVIHVWDFEGGQARRARTFFDRERAERAAGIRQMADPR
jgi:ketosteroid isomerase-like protein